MAVRDVFLRMMTAKRSHLTARQMAILCELESAGKAGRTVRGLAESLSLSKPVVSRSVDMLEKDGLARRVPNGDDRRSVDIHLLSAGKKFLSTLEVAAVAST